MRNLIQKRSKKLVSSTFLIVAILIMSLTWRSSPVKAYSRNAMLRFAPFELTIPVGSSFSVDILLRTGDEDVCTVVAVVDYPSDSLMVESVNTDDSFVSIWFENTIDNTNGEVKLTGSLSSPGINGYDVFFAKLNFLALKSAYATVRFGGDSAVYPCASTDFNILGATFAPTYRIIPDSAPFPTPTPVPDEDNDGIADAEDLCPNSPTYPLTWVDEKGCTSFQRIALLEERVVQLESVDPDTLNNRIDELESQVESQNQRISSLETLAVSIQEKLNGFIAKIQTYLSTVWRGLRSRMVCAEMERLGESNYEDLGLICEIRHGRCRCKPLQ